MYFHCDNGSDALSTSKIAVCMEMLRLKVEMYKLRSSFDLQQQSHHAEKGKLTKANINKIRKIG